MHADDMTCCSRHAPVVSAGLDGSERIQGGPHTVVASVETTVVTVPASPVTGHLLPVLGAPELET